MRRLLALTTAVTVLAAACGDDGEEQGRDRFRREHRRTTTTEVTGLDLDDIPLEDQDDVIIEAAIAEAEAFWAEAYPAAYGEELEPLTGGLYAYGPDRELPACGGPVTYEEVAENAFYCPLDDLIAWDTDNLTNDMLAEFGPYSLVIVAAHEYGHAIQERVPVGGPTILTEQQADCFAGAFTAHLAEGDDDAFEVTLDDLDAAIAGFLSLRDAVGTPTTDPDAHGSAFDRVGAFQDGFLQGVEVCVEYEELYSEGMTTAIDLPLPPDGQVDAPFDPEADGNIFAITLGSLEAFWAEALPEDFGADWVPIADDGRVVPFDGSDPETLPDCPEDDVDPAEVAGTAFTCFGDPDDPSDDVIAFDVEFAAEQYEIGDFAVSGILSREYSRIAQLLAGLEVDGLDASLQADCFSGAWAGKLTTDTIELGGQEVPDPEIEAVAITAGDLDEAVQSFLLLGRFADPEDVGTPFERVSAFRDGFFGGLQACV